MIFRKSRISTRLEKDLEGAKQKALLRMESIERRLAGREIVRTEYRHARDSIEQSVLALGAASAALAIERQLEKTLEERPELLNNEDAQKLQSIVRQKNEAAQQIALVAKKALSDPQQSLAIAQGLHSQLLESERQANSVFHSDEKNRIAQASILGTLQEQLHIHRIHELHRHAAIKLADELVIDLPKSHPGNKHHPPKRGSKSLLAKKMSLN